MFYQLHHMASSEYFMREEGDNFSYPPHLHQGFELVIVTDGEMNVRVNHVDHALGKNEAILVFPNELHELHSEHSHHVLFIFSEKLIRAFSVKYADRIPKNRVLRLSEYAYNSLLLLNTESTSVELKGALYSFAALVEKSGEFVPSFTQKDDLIRKIFAYVDDNYLKSCTLNELATALGYDNAYISRYFKRITGISYNSYVNIRRLSNASYLLHNTDSTVLECAIESGYHSLRSFNRNFKEYFGMTPAEYRSREKVR